jgi:hypothetical protein
LSRFEKLKKKLNPAKMGDILLFCVFDIRLISGRQRLFANLENAIHFFESFGPGGGPYTIHRKSQRKLLADLNRVDFHNIQEKEQVELYKTKQKKENFECRCNPEFRWPGWKNDFKITLPYNLKPHWNSAGVQWLERESSSIVSSNLWKADQPRNFVRVARQFLIKWVVCQVQQQQPIN